MKAKDCVIVLDASLEYVVFNLGITDKRRHNDIMFDLTSWSVSDVPIKTLHTKFFDEC